MVALLIGRLDMVHQCILNYVHVHASEWRVYIHAYVGMYVSTNPTITH